MTPRTRPKGQTARTFGTYMHFKSYGGGQWTCHARGQSFTVEKRRAEPGAPPGWWYFGPGAADGEWCGERPEYAAEVAIRHFEELVRRG